MENRREFLGTLSAGLAATHLSRSETQTVPAQTTSGEPSDFLAALGEAYRAKQPPVRVRKVKTTTLFKSPESSPNAISAVAEGLWVAEQRSDRAHLLDWNGKLLKSVKSE